MVHRASAGAGSGVGDGGPAIWDELLCEISGGVEAAEELKGGKAGVGFWVLGQAKAKSNRRWDGEGRLGLGCWEIQKQEQEQE